MSSNGTTNIFKHMRSLDTSAPLDAYSRVTVTVSDDEYYTSGDDTGRELTVDCPWGTQEMADNLLESVKSVQYRPLTAQGAYLDPAAELGDGIYADGLYSGIYKMSDTFGGAYTADVSAPVEEETDDAYPYQSSESRKVTRSLKNLTAELKVQAGLISAEVTARENDVSTLTSQLQLQADQISAKVSKTGGDSSSFGWTLTDSSWTISSGGSTVLTATSDGLEVSGKVTATSGKIGNWVINDTYLSFNGKTWDNDVSQGAYIGALGIKLGSNFSVDMYGNLSAASGTFTGNVYASSILYGDTGGYLSGSGISGSSISGSKLVSSTVTTSYLSSGVNTTLNNATTAYNICKGYTTFGNMIGTYLSADNITLNNKTLGTKDIVYMDANGSSHSLNVVTWTSTG